MTINVQFEQRDMRMGVDFGENQYVGGAGGVSFVTDETLRLVDGVLGVNTADAAEADNALPITSQAVYQAIDSISRASPVYVGTDEPPEDAEVWIDPEAALLPEEIPSVRVEQTADGALVTATGWDGVTTASVKNGKDGTDGKDGYTPIKGIDYFTDDDRAEMVAQVISALPVYDGEVADA